MIDIAILRANPEAVKENMRKKFQDTKLHLVDEALQLDKEYREALTRASELRSLRNKLSKEIGQFMREGKREEALIDIWCRNENLQSSHQQVCSSLSFHKPDVL